MNLAVNAADAIGSEGGEIYIATELREVDDGQAIEVKVADNGCGMGSQSRETGIGLSIMDYRARSVGAKFRISSEPHKGTRVICHIHHKYLS